MKTSRTMTAFAFFLMTAAAAAGSQGKVQPDPTDPKKACRGFKPHELCFEKPRDGVARVEYLSEPFYAVILKTTEPCMITEEERLQAQALFPRSKVFSMRFQCNDNIEENIAYTNVDCQVRLPRRLRRNYTGGGQETAGRGQRHGTIPRRQHPKNAGEAGVYLKTL